MRRCLAGSLIALICTPMAQAQEHLEPEVGMWLFRGQYDFHANFRTKIQEIFKPEVNFRAVVLPSFDESFAVGIRETEFGHEAILLLEPRIPLTAHELAESAMAIEEGLGGFGSQSPDELPTQRQATSRPAKHEGDDAAPFEIPIERHVKPLTREDARKMRRVWQEMLTKTRHAREVRLGADGTMYHFSGQFPKRGPMSGQIWSPEPNSKTWRFARLAETLADYARGKENLETLRRAISDCEY